MKKTLLLLIAVIVTGILFNGCLTKKVDKTAQATIKDFGGQIEITRMQGEEAAPVSQEIGAALIQNDIIALNDDEANMRIELADGICLNV